MKTFRLAAIAAAVVLCGIPAAALAGTTKPDHDAGRKAIAAEYKAARASCEPLTGNAKDICAAEARGREKVALAELEATHKPTAKSRYQARVARAEAAYSVAKERCDDRAGKDKDICVKEAQAAQTAAKADAKASMKVADAKQAAGKEMVEARRDATADKRDAEHALAKAKCDALAGSARDSCLAEAKARFGKP